ncbi:MAG: response regulator [Myxococcales bacterium]
MHTRTILIVDDEENVRNALKRALRREEYQILTAAGPDEGLELLKAHPVDVVLSDHLMPRMTGLQFLTLVRDRHPDVARLMLTGHADMETAIRAINDGQIYRFLQKPWDDVELKVVLHLAFEHVELERENRRLLAMVRRQADFIRDLEKQFPGIDAVVRDADCAILLPDDELRWLGRA